MRVHRIRRRTARNEEGIIIVLVAVFMLFVVGAMAALAIDVTSFYTARSEAQLVADGAALAGARVLANSGMTSNPSLATSTLQSTCQNVASQVAASNQVEGNTPSVTVTCSTSTPSTNNPTVTARVTTSLPTFFARIWGSTSVSAAASATAEAYNPTPPTGGGGGGEAPPVAPLCVKPWLLPNLDPTTAGSTNSIFDPTTGAITNTGLIGATWPGATNPTGLVGQSYPYTGAPASGKYYPSSVGGGGGNPLPVPTQTPACSGSTSFTNYQLAIAGCVPTPISCGSTPVDIDTGAYASNTGNGRDADTAQAVECLTHNDASGGGPTSGDSDSISPSTSTPPFDFVAGSQNPISSAVGKDILISDSLVTIPVYDSRGGPPGGSTTVNVIGFLQGFLNAQSNALPDPAGAGPYPIPVTIINIVGCGSAVSGTPVYGNGPSAVAVRLITP